MYQDPPTPRHPPNPSSAATTSALAIASLVLGIVGLLTSIVGIGFLLALVGLILGIIALVQIGKPQQPDKGRGLAVTGTVLSGITLLVVPIALVIGILLPALGAARQTARVMASNTHAQLIQQAMITEAQSHRPDANGNHPMTADLGELLKGNYITVEHTQSPTDQVGGDAPANFQSMPPDDQADWVRQHADFVLVPGLTDDLSHATIAVFGKPDRFDGGIPVTYNDNSTRWIVAADIPQIKQELRQQTGKSMAELIREALALP